ncbi:hypothetical protein Dimus_028750 [Dionaea muscipula]
MTVIHLKKKDVVKSSVKGISIEFDHEQCVAILDVLEEAGICEYIKEVWEESRYTKPLEITRRFANDATIMKARRVRSVEMKPSQRFIHFLSDDQFYDAQVGEEEPSDETPSRPSDPDFILDSTRRSRTRRSRPLGSYEQRCLNLRSSSEI